jgi:hypothetical protein
MAKKTWVIEPFDLAAPSERLEDHRLPDLTKECDPKVAEEDITPILASESADKKAPRNDQHAIWRLRHKQIIFSCGSIVPGGKSVILLKKQKIYSSKLSVAGCSPAI